MREFNHYRWTEFKVEKPEHVPKEPHFQAVVFGVRAESDSYGTGYYNVPDVKLYVFKDRSDLDLFIKDVTITSTSFLFYHVASLGKASI